MADYPVMLQLKGQRCVIVGAGPVGRRKLQSLANVGAERVLIAPDADREPLPADITIICRTFIDSDLDGAALVFAATNLVQTNRLIAESARKRRIPVNIVDDPQASDFTLPAVSRHGALTLAIGTSGRSPAAAAIIRDNISDSLSPGWELFIQLAAKLRSLRLTSDSNALYNRQVLHLLLERGLIQMLESGDKVGIERLLTTELSDKVTWNDLDIDLPKGAS
jgi:precorrin-2 dehydrogenase/sirohydrochlorin ferrochelatase